MMRDGWKGTTVAGRQVIYVCQERTATSADITAKVEGEENFHVQLDVPRPITRAQVEARFAALLQNEPSLQIPARVESEKENL
jgi:hypothetical protein